MSAKRLPIIVTILAILLVVGSLPVIASGQNDPPGGALSVQIDKDSTSLVAGDWVEFSTVLQNDGPTPTSALVAHLNVAALQKGHYVDPEDWSPERTRYVASIPPGDSARLTWQVHALTEGGYAAFVTVVSPEKSFVPIVSSTLSIHVEPDNILPMVEVVPVAVTVPVFPLAMLLFSVAHTRRRRPLPL